VGSPSAGSNEASADQVTVVDLAGTRETTRQALSEGVARVANGLQAISGGDRDTVVAVLSVNRAEVLELVFGAISGGVVLVPVNWHLSVGEISYILTNSAAKVLFVDTVHSGLGRKAAADAGLTEIITIGENYHDWRHSQPTTLATPAASGRLMLYSSGTTGRPKGILRPPAPDPAAFLAGIEAMANFYGYRSPGAHLVTGPLYHAAPLAFAAYALLKGQTTVLMDHFDAFDAITLIERHRITTTHMVPTMLIRLLRLPEQARADADLASLEQVYHGAAPCPPWAKQAMIDWIGPRLTEYYGASEGGGPTMAKSADWLERPGTVGRPAPGLVIEILDDDGRSVPAGEAGTVYFRAAEGPPTYHGDPDKTRESQLPDGRYTVGDIGYLDPDGYLYLIDRKTDLIISGGVNIYPAEVESCLSEHPAVADCAVFGVPDPEWGEAVKAAVQLVDGADASTDELIGWCKDRIAHYKAPKSIDLHHQLPRDDTGKLRKRLLRDAYREPASNSLR
jgi:long-chain acyl-CoA synthetase